MSQESEESSCSMVHIKPRTDEDARRLKLLEQDDMFDVTLKFVNDENKELKCHRFVLREQSNQFQELLQIDSIKSGDMQTLEVADLKHAFMLQVLRFVYGGCVQATWNEASQLLEFALTYNVDKLSAAIQDYFLSHLNTSEAARLWQLARQHGIGELMQSSYKFCLEHFVDEEGSVAQSASFLELDRHSIIELLADHQLHIPNENAAFNAILHWIVHEPQTRVAHAREILEKTLRKENLDADVIINQIQNVIGRRQVSDALWVTLMQFVASLCDVSEYGLLKPRVETDFLERLGIMSVYSNGEYLDVMEHVLDVPRTPADGDDTAQASSPLEANRSSKGVKVSDKERFEDATFEFSFVQHSIRRPLLACNDHKLRLQEASVFGELRLSRDLHEGDALFSLSNSEIIIVSRGAKHKQNIDVEVLEIRDRGSYWFRGSMRFDAGECPVEDIDLGAVYKRHWFVFAPDRDSVYVVDVDSLKLRGIVSVELHRDNTVWTVDRKLNMLVLFGASRIYVVQLDKVLQQVLEQEQLKAAAEETAAQDNTPPTAAADPPAAEGDEAAENKQPPVAATAHQSASPPPVEVACFESKYTLSDEADRFLSGAVVGDRVAVVMGVQESGDAVVLSSDLNDLQPGHNDRTWREDVVQFSDTHNIGEWKNMKAVRMLYDRPE